jgi:hypothetical protein
MMTGCIRAKTKFSLLFVCLQCFALSMRAADGPVFGPFNANARGGGPGHIEWFDGAPPTEPPAAWTVAAWIRPADAIQHRTLVAGFGDGLDFSGAERFFAADTNGWFFFVGREQIKIRISPTDQLTPEEVLGGQVDTHAPVAPDQWQHLAATYDGKTLRLFVNGLETTNVDLPLGRAAMQVLVAPPPCWEDGDFFKGKVANLAIWDRPLAQTEIAALVKTQSAGLDQLAFVPAPGGASPEKRTGPFIGRRSARLPQDPETFPKPIPSVKLERTAKLSVEPVAALNATGDLVLDRGWEMADAASVAAAPGKISAPGFDTHSWYDATVPGTVLTTLVQQGIYPDPTHGLNNLLIPDDLSRKSWWYRVQFPTPANWNGREVELTFNGINYHAETWLNGEPLGKITGAVIRGSYDVAPLLKRDGMNVLAVRVWPQPHNGATQEESPRAGAGPNGADGVLDGPTFFCSEGWDWIPTIRDRNTGIWQDVVMHPTGPIALGDSKVTTTLPRLPDLSVAEVTIQAELRNLTAQPQQVVLRCGIAGASVEFPATLQPHETKIVTATPKQFPQLVFQHPKLWWPNGYGEPTLHDLTLRVDSGGKESDHAEPRIGLRVISTTNDPQLTVLVNGRRIFCKGGNWGIDDALKQISKAKLEPYIRLHRDAHLTMIRNWCGQSTSEAFYELCDEYGLLIYNEFWLTTEDHDMPAIDGDLFLANVADTVKRIRNHPSIAVWSARNEGNPPKWIGPRLTEMLEQLDGTRTYVPSSWSFPVSGGGPYFFSELKTYFETALKKPFNTELGGFSVPAADALRAAIEPDQLWPISDSWAYHDLHLPGTNYIHAIERNFGASDNFDSFIGRAQMMNYDIHRAMFEAWNARMWHPCSGVLLWMTHPSWPSTVWQIYSHDYDTHASYFAAKKACEPIHVQWNLTDNDVVVVNNLFEPLNQAGVTLKVVGLDGRELAKRVVKLDAASSAATVATKMEWPVAPDSPVQFLELELRDRAGKLLSENFYWHSEKPEQLQALNSLPRVKLKTVIHRVGAAVVVSLKNESTTPALMAHLVLRDAARGRRVLPVYYEDNYVSLLPGETRDIRIESAAKTSAQLRLDLDGWNVDEASLQL